MITVYLDMDGVLADFDRFCVETFGTSFVNLGRSSADKWGEINKYPNIYRDLRPMSDAQVLVDRVLDYQATHNVAVGVLTALPRVGKIPLAEEHKRDWIARHFPALLENFKIGPYAPDKCKHAQQGDVLIDDMAINITQWQAVGGHGILHATAVDSIDSLSTYLNNYTQSRT